MTKSIDSLLPRLWNKEFEPWRIFCRNHVFCLNTHREVMLFCKLPIESVE